MTAAVFSVGFAAPSQAQDRIWLQIEAQPTLREAEERAHAYTGVFPDVAGFQLNSGWYAIALGPYAPETGLAKLADLKAERLVPADSFIADGRNYRQQYWPAGSAAGLTGVTVAPVESAPLPDPEAAPLAALAPEPTPVIPTPVIVEETPAQARRAEAALSGDDRRALQTALQWFGFYTSTIDGAFGPGTRKSMAAW
ncbi:MAG TPA: peptidoglycan-binding domain-containing protein, partial [Paracoccaceae bacterium]